MNPRGLEGLCKILSLDMRVIDPAWIGMKLRKLLDFPEPLGDFMAFLPGSKKQLTFPSTVSYLAAHPPLRDARATERKGPAGAADRDPRDAGEGRSADHTGWVLSRMRQLHDDPQ